MCVCVHMCAHVLPQACDRPNLAYLQLKHIHSWQFPTLINSLPLSCVLTKHVIVSYFPLNFLKVRAVE